MLDGNAYKALLSENTEPDLMPRLRDPVLLKGFAALAGDLTMIMSQIGSGRDPEHRLRKSQTDGPCLLSP